MSLKITKPMIAHKTTITIHDTAAITVTVLDFSTNKYHIDRILKDYTEYFNIYVIFSTVYILNCFVVISLALLTDNSYFRILFPAN